MFPLLCRPHCPNISWLYTFCSFVASTLICVWNVAHRLTGWTFGVSTTSGGSVHISRWILTRGNRSLWACRWSSFVAPHPFLSLSPIYSKSEETLPLPHAMDVLVHHRTRNDKLGDGGKISLAWHEPTWQSSFPVISQIFGSELSQCNECMASSSQDRSADIPTHQNRKHQHGEMLNLDYFTRLRATKKRCSKNTTLSP